MSIFGKKKKGGTGDYPCPKCGQDMEFEDERREILICTHCGFDCWLDNYGLTEDEIWDRDHPDDDEYLERYLIKDDDE